MTCISFPIYSVLQERAAKPYMALRSHQLARSYNAAMTPADIMHAVAGLLGADSVRSSRLEKDPD